MCCNVLKSLSSGILCYVVRYKLTDVSKERTAVIFSWHSVWYLLVADWLFSIHSALKMDVGRSSETSKNFSRTTLRHTQKDNTLKPHNSYIYLILLCNFLAFQPANQNSLIRKILPLAPVCRPWHGDRDRPRNVCNFKPTDIVDSPRRFYQLQPPWKLQILQTVLLSISYKFCILVFLGGATAPVWALAYLHETLRFTSVY
jgi:hypothetical protein